MNLNHPYLPHLLILLFLLITFVVSVIEKLSDWSGTISYISETFKNSLIKNFIKPLIAFLVFLEVLTVYFITIGIYQLFIDQEKENALLGSTISCISILYMLIGQRIAKDYPGATSLTVYFILSVFGVYLLN